jgi:pimeloyl-ACP methyl ester carboxylesterase
VTPRPPGAVSERLDPRTTGAQLLDFEGRDVAADEIRQPAVVFIHGLFHNSERLERFASYVARNGFHSLLFNYDSSGGIRVAAQSLERRLSTIAEPLLRHGYVLVGYSMGGLVARRFAAHAEAQLLDALRGLLLLGVPNRGIMPEFTAPKAAMVDQFLRAMFYVADHLDGVDPLRLASCLAVRQLLMKDADKIIPNLNQHLRALDLPFSMLSVSGGRAYLKTRTPVENRILQKLIAETPNDGLVGESNADASNLNSRARHRRDYSDYLDINHTNLVLSQEIFNLTTEWLRTVTSR